MTFVRDPTLECHLVQHDGNEMTGRTKVIKERFYALHLCVELNIRRLRFLIDSARGLLL